MNREHLINRFFAGPTPIEMAETYPWRQEEHPRITDSRAKWDVWKVIRQYFEPTLSSYLLLSEEICDAFRKACVNCARQLAEQCDGVRFYESSDLALILNRCRLRTLLLSPSIIADSLSLDILRELRDLNSNEPYGFENWARYEADRGYHLLPSFGRRQLDGFVRIATCDDLWSGKSSEMKRVLFASVAQALRLLSVEKGLTVEGGTARIDIIERNKAGAANHEPKCAAAFYEKEFDDKEPTEALMQLREEVGAKACWQTPHCC